MTSLDTKEAKCPFLAEVQKNKSLVTEASAEIQDDVIRVNDSQGKKFNNKFLGAIATPSTVIKFFVRWLSG